MASFTIIWEQQNEGYTGRCMEIPGIQGRGRHLGNTWHSRQELKANMTEAITSALRLMRKESDEWGGKEIITKIWKMASSAMFLPRVLVASEFG